MKIYRLSKLRNNYFKAGGLTLVYKCLPREDCIILMQFRREPINKQIMLNYWGTLESLNGRDLAKTQGVLSKFLVLKYSKENTMARMTLKWERE